MVRWVWAVLVETADKWLQEKRSYKSPSEKDRRETIWFVEVVSTTTYEDPKIARADS